MKNKLKIMMGIMLLFVFGIIYVHGSDIIKYKTVVTSKEQKFAPVNTAFKDDDLYKCVVYFYNNKSAESYNGSSNYGTVDTNVNLTDDQLSTITRLQCDGINGDTESQLNIKNTKGIEKLTSLTDLHLRGHNIPSIDISNNTKLAFLSLDENHISSIDISKNSSLMGLSLDGNPISKINLTNNTKLKSLSIVNTCLTDLDISKNHLLEYLSVEENSFKSLDLSYASSLKVLYMNNSLDTEQNKMDTFKWLRVNQNYKPLSSLNVKLPSHFSFFDSVSDNKMLNYKYGIIKAIKPGTSNYEIYVSRKDELDDKELAFSTLINVYDLQSDVYTIKGNTIYNSKDEALNIKKIKIVNGNELTLKIDGTTLKVLDGDNIIEKLNIVYENVSNPKTMDANVLVYAGIILCTMLVLGISIKKVKATK